jgi:GntR family transcriptional regulator
MSGRVSSPPSLQLRSEKTIGERARDAVMELIARDELKAGDKLPSEAELSQMFNISRPTLREALKLLEQDGIIFTTHGRGRFVSAAAALRVERPITAYESIASMLRELGYKPQTRVMSVGEQPADKETARALRCRIGTPVVAVERLRHQGMEPLIYCVEIIRRDCLPETLDADSFKGSLNDLLALKRKRPRMSSASVSAVKLPAAITRVVGTKYAGPWLLITETCFTDRGEPVIFARDYHRGDAFSFNFSRR